MRTRASHCRGPWPTCTIGPVSAETERAVDRCRQYRRDLGFPAVVAPGTRRIVVHADFVGAVAMPSVLALRVRACMGRPGPVVAHPGSARATFLTGPTDGRELELFALLLRLNIGIASTYTVLPSPVDERLGYRVWLDEPSRVLPPQRAVLESLVAVSRDC